MTDQPAPDRAQPADDDATGVDLPPSPEGDGALEPEPGDITGDAVEQA